MGDDSQISAVGKGSIKFKHGVFKNLLKIFFFVYQMNHTSSPKQVTFDPDIVEISEISTRNMIAKGVSNHAFKACEFSHFLPNSYASSLLTHANDTSMLWHEIFGHLNFKYLQ